LQVASVVIATRSMLVGVMPVGRAGGLVRAPAIDKAMHQARHHFRRHRHRHRHRHARRHCRQSHHHHWHSSSDSVHMLPTQSLLPVLPTNAHASGHRCHQAAAWCAGMRHRPSQDRPTDQPSSERESYASQRRRYVPPPVERMGFLQQQRRAATDPWHRTRTTCGAVRCAVRCGPMRT